MARAKILENVEMPSFLWQFRSWEDIKQSTWFTKINWINIAMLVVFVAVAIRQAQSKMEAAKKAGFEKRFIKAPKFPQPDDQPDFDHTKTEPLKLRPFKAKYHLTMALANLDPNDLILMDKNYADRMAYRKSIMQNHGKNVVNVQENDYIATAVREYYAYLMGTYLPLRFPSMFKLHEAEYETGKTFMLENKISGSVHPASPISKMTKITTLLETLGKTIDEDVFFLLPEEAPEGSDFIAKYVLQAYVCCCPSGFNPSDKLGLRLASIHDPVPGYKDKLEGSMDRFFNNLEVGKYVKRVNWSVTTDTDLYAAGADTNHAYEGDDVTEMKAEDLDLENTYLRCERQTVFRLPTSEAIVFSFKTYRYPIKEIKEEGLGEELAEAIDGLKGGNVPGMHLYKRGVVWGEAVKKYLRS